MAVSGDIKKHDTGSAGPHRILVVDDEDFMRDLLREMLTLEGYEVTTANDGEDAVPLLEREGFDLVVTDLMMPRLNGIDVLRAAKRVDPRYPVVIITGYPSVETVVKLIRLGAADYISKPFNIDVIKATVAKLLEMNRIHPPPEHTESDRAESDIPDDGLDPPDPESVFAGLALSGGDAAG